jgi:hypothetical protein
MDEGTSTTHSAAGKKRVPVSFEASVSVCNMLTLLAEGVQLLQVFQSPLRRRKTLFPVSMNIQFSGKCFGVDIFQMSQLEEDLRVRRETSRSARTVGISMSVK